MSEARVQCLCKGGEPDLTGGHGATHKVSTGRMVLQNHQQREGRVQGLMKFKSVQWAALSVYADRDGMSQAEPSLGIAVCYNIQRMSMTTWAFLEKPDAPGSEC